MPLGRRICHDSVFLSYSSCQHLCGCLPGLAFPRQGDSFGDLCDRDLDNDGVDNRVDNCPRVCAGPGVYHFGLRLLMRASVLLVA